MPHLRSLPPPSANTPSAPPSSTSEPTRDTAAEQVYGLDIETDTRIDGLDPDVAAVVAIAVATDAGEQVFAGEERALLAATDRFLASLTPGIIVTWYGSGFDLPFVQRRAHLGGVALGLRTRDRSGGGIRGEWHGHRHLDAYRVYRNDLPRLLDISCSLKSVAKLLGYEPVEVDIAELHRLGRTQLAEYVASDARLCRAAALRRWATAEPFVDQLAA